MNLSESDILRYAIDNGIVDINTIQKQIEMNERLKFLEMHESRVWQSTDNKWYTYLPDSNSKNGRRLIKRSTEKAITDAIVEHYKQAEHELTVDEVFNRWLKKKLDYMEITMQTANRYQVDFGRFFDNNFKKQKIKYITCDYLEDFVVRNIKHYNLKSKAWGNLRTIIKGMFLFAKKKGYCNLDVTKFFAELELSKRVFNHEKKADKDSVYSEAEVSKLLDIICDSKSLNDIAIMFAIYTGMRVGEIVSLKWEDINEQYIYVNRTQIRYYDENKRLVHEVRNFPKTEAGIRHVVVVPELRQIIKRLRLINPFSEYAFERNGECIHKHSVCTRLYNLCDKLEIKHRGMHALRKYYATKLINAGVEESIIISQMGHTDFSTTKKFYYKNNSEREYIINRITEAIS